MHAVLGCPTRACLFHLSDVSENDRPFSDGGFAKDKKLAEWSDVREFAVAGWGMLVISRNVPDATLLPPVRLEPGSTAQADPESTDSQ